MGWENRWAEGREDGCESGMEYIFNVPLANVSGGILKV